MQFCADVEPINNDARHFWLKAALEIIYLKIASIGLVAFENLVLAYQILSPFKTKIETHPQLMVAVIQNWNGNIKPVNSAVDGKSWTEKIPSLPVGVCRISCQSTSLGSTRPWCWLSMAWRSCRWTLWVTNPPRAPTTMWLVNDVKLMKCVSHCSQLNSGQAICPLGRRLQTKLGSCSREVMMTTGSESLAQHTDRTEPRRAAAP